MNVDKSSFREDEVRKIVRDELSYLIPEIEKLDYSKLSKKDILKLKEAKEEYKKGNIHSFEEVYEEIMKE